MSATFTRKHYVEIACILSGVRDAHEKQRLAEEFARMFRQDNPQFDAERFSSAVFGEGGRGRAREVAEESKALTAARAKLATRGMLIQKTEWGDYRVYPRGSGPDEGYFTDDLDDAVATGMSMSRGGAPAMQEARRAARPAPREADAGFAIGVYDQRNIEDNAWERFGPKWGEKEHRDRAMQDGLVDAEGKITQKGWDLIGDDSWQLEDNAMKWMRKTFRSAQDQGHDQHGDLVGSFTFDPTNPDHAWLVELASPSPGRNERIDMTDASYGDLAHTAFDGVSDFGASVLGGAITFFDVKPEDMEAIEQTLEAERKRSKRGR